VRWLTGVAPPAGTGATQGLFGITPTVLTQASLTSTATRLRSLEALSQWTIYVQTMAWIESVPVPHYRTSRPSSAGVGGGGGSGAAGGGSPGGAWSCIRWAESGDNYSEATGNGYYGAYQFLPSTWNNAVSGAGFGNYANGRADLAPAAVQDAAAQWLQANSGWGQWSTSDGCGV
jgi:hypothetical protein